MPHADQARGPRADSLPTMLLPAAAAQAIRANQALRLLDVRTPAEFESAHIAGAYNVPLDTLAEHAREIRNQVGDPILLVCQSGQRARRGEETLKASGLARLHILDGGMNGWVAAGLPVVRGRHTLSLERQVRIAAGALAATGGLLAVLVDPLFGVLSALVGGGLVFAGVTDTCGMAMLLSRLPYNRRATCDVGAMVRALSEGRPPHTGRTAPAATSTCGPSRH